MINIRLNDKIILYVEFNFSQIFKQLFYLGQECSGDNLILNKIKQQY